MFGRLADCLGTRLVDAAGLDFAGVANWYIFYLEDKNRPDLARMLLEARRDIDVNQAVGETSFLAIAAANNRPEICGDLLNDRGADPSMPVMGGMMLIHLVKRDHIDIFTLALCFHYMVGDEERMERFRAFSEQKSPEDWLRGQLGVLNRVHGSSHDVEALVASFEEELHRLATEKPRDSQGSTDTHSSTDAHEAEGYVGGGAAGENNLRRRRA